MTCIHGNESCPNLRCQEDADGGNAQGWTCPNCQRYMVLAVKAFTAHVDACESDYQRARAVYLETIKRVDERDYVAPCAVVTCDKHHEHECDGGLTVDGHWYAPGLRNADVLMPMPDRYRDEFRRVGSIDLCGSCFQVNGHAPDCPRVHSEAFFDFSNTLQGGSPIRWIADAPIELTIPYRSFLITGILNTPPEPAPITFAPRPPLTPEMQAEVDKARRMFEATTGLNDVARGIDPATQALWKEHAHEWPAEMCEKCEGKPKTYLAREKVAQLTWGEPQPWFGPGVKYTFPVCRTAAGNGSCRAKDCPAHPENGSDESEGA